MDVCVKCVLLVVVLHLHLNLCTIFVSGEPQRESIPLVRLPSNTLLKYTAYKDVSILHFDIPADTRTANFNFKAYEETKSAFQRQCKPRDVTLHLKSGSYPVISPENITFPKHFLHVDQRFEIYNLQFKSDGVMRRLSIDGPNMGDWFAVAFITWTDPNNDRIEQQGIAASCETLLLSEMSVVSATPIILNGGHGVLHNNTLYGPVSGHIVKNNSSNDSSVAGSRNRTNKIRIANNSGSSSSSISSNNASINNDKSPASVIHEPINYKFFVPRNVDVVTLHFRIWQICAQCPPIMVYAQANALPAPKSFIQTSIIYANKTDETIMDFYPQQNAWHYIEIGWLLSGDDGGKATPSSSSSSTSTLPSTKSFKPKNNKFLKNKSAIRMMESNIFVNFSLGLEFIEEKFSAESVRDSENENETMAADTSSNRNSNGNGGLGANSELINRTAATHIDSPPVSSDRNNQQIDIDVAEDDSTATITKKLLLSTQPRNINYYSLLRQTYREFFMFDYDLLPDDNGTVPSFINLTAGIPTGFRFNVGNVYDIGGTLSFAVVMKDNLRDATIAAAASASILKPRNRIASEAAVAEKLVHINNDNNEDSKGHGEGESGGSSGSSNGGNGIGSMNYELDHLNVNDVGGGISRTDNAADDETDNGAGRSNQTIIICMRLGEPGIPTWPDKCIYGQRILPAASIVNNTNDETSTGLIHVPFPEPGMWYVTLGVYCHGAETAARTTIIDSVKEFIKKYVDILNEMRAPCSCANHTSYYRKCIGDLHCLYELNESETLKVKECMMDSKCTQRHQEMAHKFELHHRFATEQSVATDSSCNASAVFTISSSPCVAGRCGRYGRCYHYMSGGFVFSTCLCIKGYRGWDCTEDSQVPSSFSILLALLLLTLSNLLFIPSIYVAVRRKYFTEGIIYFFAMFFSIFYHACDSGEDEYSFCLVKIGVLQFCDFYCGLLAIWVTLIAMAHIRQTFVSLLHMFGAIVLAFGTELNKQSLWVFLAPALTGLCLISVSWGWRCQRTRKWFPARKYLSIFMPIGMVLVMGGLICYAFLQTRQNYHIVHSVWHMVMALSILCLLPSRNSFLPKC